MLLDLTDELHDAPVLEQDAVVDEAPELLGEARDGALRDLARLQPVVVDTEEARVGPELEDRIELKDGA